MGKTENMLATDETILFDLPSNLDVEGESINAKIVITNKRILRFEVLDDHAELVSEFDLKGIHKLEAQTLVGNGRLNIWLTDDSVVNISRFSLEHLPNYSVAEGYVNRYLEEREFCARLNHWNRIVVPDVIDRFAGTLEFVPFV